ncbi:hypothetical protein PybrP1_012302 [[Pythium] brassicae (nom. inval.)]|nr:hypothetical protein PybrP1_012302 [[Pythium] brassicae (nom. inval.)]
MQVAAERVGCSRGGASSSLTAFPSDSDSDVDTGGNATVLADITEALEPVWSLLEITSNCLQRVWAGVREFSFAPSSYVWIPILARKEVSDIEISGPDSVQRASNLASSYEELYAGVEFGDNDFVDEVTAMDERAIDEVSSSSNESPSKLAVHTRRQLHSVGARDTTTSVAAVPVNAGLAAAVAADDSGGGFRFDAADASALPLFGGDSEWLWAVTALQPQIAQQQARTSNSGRRARVPYANRPNTGDATADASESHAGAGGGALGPAAMGAFDRDPTWRAVQQGPAQGQFHGGRAQHNSAMATTNSSAGAAASAGGALFLSHVSDVDRRQQLPSAAASGYTAPGSQGPGGSLGYYPSSGESPSVGKRPRLSSTTSSSGGSSTYGRSSPVLTPSSASSMGTGGSGADSFLRPLESAGGASGLYGGYQHQNQSPPLTIQTQHTGYERENPLPDFSNDWFFSRMSPVMSSLSSAPTPTAASSSNNNNNSSSNNNASNSGSGHGMSIDVGANSGGRGFSGLGLGSPSMLGGSELIPDYDQTFYSLWTGPNSGNLIAYDPDADRQQQQTPQAQAQRASGPTTPAGSAASQQHLYLPEEELRIEYPQLSELNQGDFDYLYGPMESGAQTPTTPLGTCSHDYLSKPQESGASAGAVGDRRLLTEPRMERPVVMPSNHRKRKTTPDSSSSSRPASSASGSKHGVRSPATPSMSSTPDKPLAGAGSGGFRSLARNASIDTRRSPHHRQVLQQPSPVAQPPQSVGAVRLSAAGDGMASPTLRQPPAAPTPPASSSSSRAGKNSKAAAVTAELDDDEDMGALGGSAPKKTRSRQCDYPGCLNRARSHQKCKKHGGAHQCVHEGCTKNSQSRGLCIAHGGGSRCKFEGCVRASQSKGLCKSHGGGEYCAVDGCHKKAHLKHLCRNHGGGVRCKDDKCAKWAQRKGWCMAHAKEALGA